MRGLSVRAVAWIAIAVFWFSLAPRPARAEWVGAPLSKSSSLPAPFSFATADDALAATYPSYLRSLGIARELRAAEGDAAHLSILEARPWYVGGRTYLVVAIARQTDDQIRRDRICGVCLERFAVAILAEHDGTLRLIARTHDDGPTQAEPKPGSVDPLLSVTGDGTGSLDLAPYRLSSSETLIGVRNTNTIVGGNFTTTLILFRIVRNELQAVASIDVGGGTNGPSGTLDHATVTVVRGPSTYNDLHVLTSHYNYAPVGPGYSDEPKPRTTPVDTDLSTFRFDGTRFHEIGGARH